MFCNKYLHVCDIIMNLDNYLVENPVRSFFFKYRKYSILTTEMTSVDDNRDNFFGKKKSRQMWMC